MECTCRCCTARGKKLFSVCFWKSCGDPVIRGHYPNAIHGCCGRAVTRQNIRSTFGIVATSKRWNLKLTLSRGDPLRTDFLFTDNKVLYTSDTTTYSPASYGRRAKTTITRRDPVGRLLEIGVIEWPADPHDRPRVVIRTRSVEMTKTGLYTS